MDISEESQHDGQCSRLLCECVFLVFGFNFYICAWGRKLRVFCRQLNRLNCRDVSSTGALSNSRNPVFMLRLVLPR